MLATFLIALALTAQGPDKTTSVRAYVFTATSASGEHSAEEQARLSAVRDLKEALAKKKGMTVVNDRADANLLVEVTSSEQKDDMQGPFGGKAITSLGDAIIRLHVKSGDQESDLKGMGQGT